MNPLALPLRTSLAALLAGTIGGLTRMTGFAATFTPGREVAPLSPQRKPGDFFRVPEVSPTGPVVLIVSIPKQEWLVYRNGVGLTAVP